MLDLVTTGYLHSLRKFPELLFTAVISSSSLSAILRKRNSKKLIIDASVNIIGLARIADDVGNTLADNSAYLQHPFSLQTGIRYVNPQYFYSRKESMDLRRLIGPPTVDSRSVLVSKGVENLLESLDDLSHHAVPPGSQAASAAAGERLILTPLKRHQGDGLKFILNRENLTFCDLVTSELKALIGSRFFPHNRSSCLGGIVADVMGLGKTLTMLSAVVCSKDTATEFAKIDSCRTRTRPTKATLIVVTSRQVLDVWISEIEKHLMPDTLRVALFHGDSRAKTTEALVDYDIVLTTYRTLVFDGKGGRVLQAMEWFRVVLDEAHWIRNQSSEQFKAAEGLQAERRWCLTGTPIQNSLDDLRSLLSFLQFQPFATPAFFEKYIVEPLRSDSHDSFRNLKLLLRTICLRRSAVYLHLPSAQTEEIPITLTPEETTVYDGILADCQAEFDKMVSTKAEIKKYNVLFTTIMKLRRLCNHGTLQAATPSCPTPPGKRRKFGKQRISTDIKLFCEFCGEEDEDTAALLGSLDVCPRCSRCLVSQEASLSQTPMNGLSPAPPPSSLALGVSASRSSTSQSLSPISASSTSGLQAGYSSKLVAVTDNIQKSLNDSKSLVFTSWRLTLDILGQMLTNRGIPFLRIDGRVKMSDRLDILSKFRGDPSTPVLLMSIETGAVGLTLTVANRVHIVEPQWNPSVEEQAIARALRMGQTRAVTVVRYVTENTVERNILTLQEKKSQLAKFSLDGGTDDKATGELDNLKFVLDARAQ
ncbi:hypothetical protein K458DRAFT_38039 [Lentithecium fluviatile CBS 122367]|uniref:P-loop containing nucleoside triphosphate hydrolase protein n=1 Tax=Lentithecium fluviatile CBS 122367 TaxID=1168545 RepID=A0A6G1J1R2_9PLEO|nr:hypothetical protein K458DRAFT_38039 [Lentithecium fluviatile CBS 122367]